MANLLSWGANAIRRDVLNPIGNVVHDVYQPVQQAAKGIGSSAINVVAAPTNVARVAAADISHNQIARQNALNTLAQSQHAIGGLAQWPGSALGSIGATALNKPNFTPTNSLERLLAGNHPTASIQGAYNQSRKSGSSVATALTHSALQAASDLPVGLKGIKVASKGGKALRTYDKAQNQIGAVGKNANKTNVPIIKGSDGLPPVPLEHFDKSEIGLHGKDLGAVGQGRFAGIANDAIPLANKADLNKVGVLSQASKFQAVRADANRIMYGLSDRVGSGIKDPAARTAHRLNYFNNLSHDLRSAGTPEGAHLKAEIDKIVGSNKPSPAPPKNIPGKSSTPVRVPIKIAGQGTLSPQELMAGRALGMNKRTILQAKNTNGLETAFKTIASNTPPEDLAALKPKEQMAITNILSKMPTKTRNIPPSAAKGISELPPMQQLPTANKLFSNKVNAIRKIGGEHANALASRIQNVETDSRTMRANWMSRIPTVQRLNKGETANFFDAVEKKAPPTNAKVAQAVKEWNKVTPDIHKTGTQEGLLVGQQKNYIPHQYDLNKIKKNGSAYDAALQHLIQTNRVDHATAVQLFKDMQAENARWPNRFGHFENSRLTNMPGYSKDKQTLYNYIQGAAQRTAESRHLGIDNQVANKLLDNIRINGGDVTSATRAVENYMRSADKGIGAGTLRGARGVFGVARLGKAAISHAGQTSNTAVDTGIARNTASWGKFLARTKGNKEFVAKTGVTNPQELHAYQDQFTSVKGVMSKATAPGLNQMMKVNRSVTAIAYRDYANSLARKGNESELRSLGVTGKIGSKLTAQQELQAARSGVDRTMFNPSRATTPIYAETPIGKTVGQYRTAYVYKQTGFIYDRIIKEAGRGNLKPLLRFLAVSAPIGAGTIAIKQKISGSGSQEGPGGKALDVAGSLGGLPGEAAIQLLRYGKKDLTKTVAGTIAPLAGEAVDLGTRTTQALQGKPQQLERYAAGLIPLVGNRVAGAAIPYAAKPPAPDNSGATGTPVQEKANSTAIVKQLTNNPNPYDSLQKLPNGKFVTQINGDVSQYATLQEAQKAVRDAHFKASGDAYKVVGDVVLRRAADGSVSQTTKTKFDYQIGTATLTAQKNAGDVQGWLGTAHSQIDSIAKQLKDPSIDPLDALTLQNDATTLQNNIDKYTAYGGFTKPKSARASGSGGAKAVSSLKTASLGKLSAPKGISVRKPAAFKAPTARKLSVSKIPATYKSKSIA